MNHATKRHLVTLGLIWVAVGAGLFFLAAKREPAPQATEEKGYHYSSHNSGKYFQDIYQSTKSYPLEGVPKGLVINHHLFVADYIADGLEAVGNNNPVTIVIISPDHFSGGSTSLTLSEYYWSTPFGDLAPDLGLVSQLLNQTTVSVQEDAFVEEHGISNLTPFVKHSFPNAKIVPILVKENTTAEELDQLAATLSSSSNIFLIGSFDFTHFENVATSREKDSQSLGALKSVNANGYKKITVDSKEGIYLMMKIAKLKGAETFQKFENSSSAELLKNFVTKDNTSYITGIFY